MSEGAAKRLSAADAAARALSALEGGAPLALVTVVSAPDSRAAGLRLIVGDEAAEGTLGSRELDERAVAAAREVLVQGGRELRELESAGGVWELYIESVVAPPELLIVGAGHIARPLSRLGSMLGFRVTVVDDRPEYADRAWLPEADDIGIIDFSDPFAGLAIRPESYVVLVTRGHKYDYDCIKRLLEMDVQPAYLGMIGSRRRVRAAFEALVADGVSPSRLEHVHAPVGLDIGAETPEEIALAIAAEIVAVRRGGSGGMLAGQERVLARVARKRAKRN
ncbi:MAG TPA: XdhC/CoxI family protein [Solirubrobacterales bacterium]